MAPEAAVVELRGPCDLLMARLDLERGVVEVACRHCSRRAGRPVYHWFDVATGRPIDQGALADAAGGTAP